MVFASVGATMLSLASAVAASSRHATDLLFSCCWLLRFKQEQAIAAVVGCASNFITIQLMWDECKHRVIPFGEKPGRGTDVSVRAAHARVSWHDGEDLKASDTHSDEVTVPPMAMDSTRAVCTWSVVRLMLPGTIWGFLVATMTCAPQ